MRTASFGVTVALLITVLGSDYALGLGDVGSREYATEFLPNGVSTVSGSPYDFRAFVPGALGHCILRSDGADRKILVEVAAACMRVHLQNFLKEDFLPSAEVVREGCEFARSVCVIPSDEPVHMDFIYLTYKVGTRTVVIARGGSTHDGVVAFTFRLRASEGLEATDAAHAKDLAESLLEEYFVIDADAPYDLQVSPSDAVEGIMCISGNAPRQRDENYRQAMRGIMSGKAVTLVFKGWLFYPDKEGTRSPATASRPDEYFDGQLKAYEYRRGLGLTGTHTPPTAGGMDR